MNQGSTREIIEGISIDAPQTKVIEQGISVEKSSTGTILSLSIVDPLNFLRPGTGEDALAYNIGFTTNSVSIVPSSSAVRLSFRALTVKNAITISIPIRSDNSIGSPHVRRTLFRNEAALSYEEADKALQEPNSVMTDEVQEKLANAEQLCRQIVASSAINFEYEQAQLIKLSRLRAQFEPETLSSNIVKQFSILVNRVMAEYFIREGIPGIFKNQFALLEVGGARYNVTNTNQLIKILLQHPTVTEDQIKFIKGNSFYDLEPQGNWNLNLPHYLQVTAPLRRYADLVNLRQVVTHKEENRSYHDTLAVKRIAHYLNQLTATPVKNNRPKPHDEDFRTWRDNANIDVIKQGNFQSYSGREFNGIVASAYRTLYITDPLIEEMRRRLYKGDIQAKGLNRILFFDYPAKVDSITDLQHEILTWLGENISIATQILEILISKDSTLPRYKPKYSIAEVIENNTTYYSTSSYVSTENENYVSRLIRSSTPALGRGLANLSLLHKIIGKEEVVTNQELDDLANFDNLVRYSDFKDRLIELAHANNWDIKFIQTQNEGNPQDAPYTHASVVLNGRVIRSGHYSNAIQYNAENKASKDIIKRLPVEILKEATINLMGTLEDTYNPARDYRAILNAYSTYSQPGIHRFTLIKISDEKIYEVSGELEIGDAKLTTSEVTVNNKKVGINQIAYQLLRQIKYP
jgi:hypothetical protein